MTHRQTDTEDWRYEMSMRSGTNGKRGIFRLTLQTVLLLTASCLISANAAIEGQESQDRAVVTSEPRHHYKPSLDGRVKALAQGLDLDAMQQSELRKVLQAQHEQVSRVWNDASTPAAYRISATQAVSNKAADQIRVLLNEEQRKKFNPPKKPTHEAMAGSAKPNVEGWMDAVRPKQAGSPPVTDGD